MLESRQKYSKWRQKLELLCNAAIRLLDIICSDYVSVLLQLVFLVHTESCQW